MREIFFAGMTFIISTHEASHVIVEKLRKFY